VLSPPRVEALGIRTEAVRVAEVGAVLRAPGQVIPDESRYAFITPRARGVVRSVDAQIGQIVREGDLLARIDSSEVAEARLGLIDAFQALEVARAKLSWQDSVHENSLEMIDALQDRLAPSEVQQQFTDRPVGKTREELLRSYANFYLAEVNAKRFSELMSREAVAPATFQEKQAEYQVELATFQGLMDRMAFEVTLDYTLARQAAREARTAVKVARERLRVLGVPVDDLVEQFESGETTGEDPRPEPARTLREAAESAASPSREVSDLMEAQGDPVGTYELRAPFTGTILDRERIVPGVVVTGQAHLFTMADLGRVWVEAYVQESDFGLLAGGRGGRIEFTSPAYPDQVFAGEILYTGDLVDEESRSIRLLASAENPGRVLKPGMFVNVEIHGSKVRRLPGVPESALLTDGPDHFVFVRAGADRFERRAVRPGVREDDRVAILDGLKTGEHVVVQGAFDLKALQENPGRPPAGR
jgi:multidrug efflux pump subunit AcrA (membrane-fusion protein)